MAVRVTRRCRILTALISIVLIALIYYDSGHSDPCVHQRQSRKKTTITDVLHLNNIHIDGIEAASTFDMTREIMNLPTFDRSAIVGNDNANRYQIEQSFLNCLSNGHFYPKYDTKKEEKDALMKVLRENVWPNLKIPANISRADGKCGNVAIEQHWVRALCDPDSDKACCYNYQCASKSEQECRCENCYDMRQRIHPEFADYKVKNKCQLNEMSHGSACEIFEKKNIQKLVVMGDSLARHLYSGFLIHLRENMETGVLAENESPELKVHCSGLQQFTEKMCRDHIEWNGTVCNGQLHVQMSYANHHGDVNAAVECMKQSPRRTLLINSIGMHSHYNTSLIMETYLDPLLALIRLQQLQYREETDSTEKCPKYIWTTPHIPGLLKGPKFADQEEKPLREYADKMAEYFKRHHIVIFNTFNATQNVFSWDGTHYGRQFNMVLAQILMTFIDAIL